MKDLIYSWMLQIVVPLSAILKPSLYWPVMSCLRTYGFHDATMTLTLMAILPFGNT